MSLQDEHLRQALKNAPDHDLVPGDAVRKKVLDYAQQAAKAKHESWLRRCFNVLSKWRITSWQLVGMSTVASVMLVTVMLRQQLPEESVWLNSDAKDIAQTEMDSPATSSAASTDQQEEFALPGKEEKVSPSADVGLAKRLEESEPTERSDSKSEKAQKMVVAKTKPVKKRAPKTKKPAMDLSDKKDAVVAAPAPAPAPAPAALAGLHPLPRWKRMLPRRQ